MFFVNNTGLAKISVTLNVNITRRDVLKILLVLKVICQVVSM